jgi:hypothetical protein
MTQIFSAYFSLCVSMCSIVGALADELYAIIDRVVPRSTEDWDLVASAYNKGRAEDQCKTSTQLRSHFLQIARSNPPKSDKKRKAYEDIMRIQHKIKKKDSKPIPPSAPVAPLPPAVVSSLPSSPLLPPSSAVPLMSNPSSPLLPPASVAPPIILPRPIVCSPPSSPHMSALPKSPSFSSLFNLSENGPEIQRNPTSFPLFTVRTDMDVVRQRIFLVVSGDIAVRFENGAHFCSE